LVEAAPALGTPYSRTRYFSGSSNERTMSRLPCAVLAFAAACTARVQTTPASPTQHTVVAIYAHPDDETIVSPALAHYARTGARGERAALVRHEGVSHRGGVPHHAHRLRRRRSRRRPSRADVPSLAGHRRADERELLRPRASLGRRGLLPAVARWPYRLEILLMRIPVIPSERIEPAVIPSERSESRDLHLPSAASASSAVVRALRVKHVAGMVLLSPVVAV